MIRARGGGVGLWSGPRTALCKAVFITLLFLFRRHLRASGTLSQACDPVVPLLASQTARHCCHPGLHPRPAHAALPPHPLLQHATLQAGHTGSPSDLRLVHPDRLKTPCRRLLSDRGREPMCVLATVLLGTAASGRAHEASALALDRDSNVSGHSVNVS